MSLNNPTGSWASYSNQQLDSIAISVKSHRLLTTLLNENPKLKKIFNQNSKLNHALVDLKEWFLEYMNDNPVAFKYFKREKGGRSVFERLSWSDYAAIRLLDYIDNADTEYIDLNLRGRKAISHPFKVLWLAVKEGCGGGKTGFFTDMIELFRQFRGKEKGVRPTKERVQKWMDRHPSGNDERILKLRRENKDRIIDILIKKIDEGEFPKHKKYRFEENTSFSRKQLIMLDWWEEYEFHLAFAIRTPELLNELLDFSLEKETLDVLFDAKKAGIPFFINPYYLSLLHVREPYFAVGADLALRDYIIYSKNLVREFGHIVAWEKEDTVKPGEPNAAGWILPSEHNIHRRYPEVAILIPDTMGRACGGLCASCQRMYDFQSGHLNFNLSKLKPEKGWDQRLEELMNYYENDSQLRDILITGGDALMSSDNSLKRILDAVYEMAVRKKEANKSRAEGEKYAEILRVRLGSRLPAYLPQRITPKLVKILKEFKDKASTIGIKQFIIQTHFQSTMEITMRARSAMDVLTSAGWTVTNQHVFTAAASRRGHNAKLRKELNDIGVLTYYTFTVKGYMENSHNFAPNARAVQEQMEEKVLGIVPDKYDEIIKTFPEKAETMIENINSIRESEDLPFIATDRNVLNLPGIGKSLTFRVIGITRYGRRVLEFDHDHTRTHSPKINDMDKVLIIESKSIEDYLNELDEMGEDVEDYRNIFGYSLGETEHRFSVYEYPEYDFKITDDVTNLG
jgi:lysine 2,3-aminomutase